MIPQEWPASSRPFTANPPPDTVGIVLPVRDNLRFVKLALHSILDFTAGRYMLTLVDNMSGFKTRQYLESARSNNPINVLQHQTSRSLSAIWNTGVRFMFAYSNVRYAVVLTPSVVMSPGWLGSMVKAANHNPTTGLVNPHSVLSTHDRVLSGTDIEHVWPFCTLIKRTLYERLSGFDETYTEPGHCIQDFTERARKAGFRAFCDDETYVHNYWRYGWQPDSVAQAKDAERLLATYSRGVPALNGG
ncbi:MAG: hypothetical protein UMS36scaffold28_21 [Phage 59_13]|nr:MAG: hypothetical protein UMS36scaffold28_21 [Phage 59_13]